MTLNLNNIKLGYDKLISGDFKGAKETFLESYKILENDDFFLDKRYFDSYISLCKGLAEANLKENNTKEALNNYLLIYNKISKEDFDTLATLGQLYKNIGDIKSSSFFLQKARELNLGKFKERFGESDDIGYRHEVHENFYLYIISKCNFSCIFCDRGTKEYKNNLKLETTLEEVKNLFLNLNRKEIPGISIGGNEPLTNKNIYQIFEFLNSLNLPLTLYTSGSEIETLEKLFIFKNLKIVFLPLYSNNPSLHDKIVGKSGAFTDLKLIEKLLIENKITLYYNKLLINANSKEEDFIKKGESFNTLHPKDKDLYIENSISLTRIIKKIDFSLDFYEILKQNTIPLCIYYDKIKENNEIITKIKNNFQELYNSKNSQNLLGEYEKTKKCEKCTFNKYCLGYYKLYFQKFSDKELDPILQ